MWKDYGQYVIEYKTSCCLQRDLPFQFGSWLLWQFYILELHITEEIISHKLYDGEGNFIGLSLPEKVDWALAVPQLGTKEKTEPQIWKKESKEKKWHTWAGYMWCKVQSMQKSVVVKSKSLENLYSNSSCSVIPVRVKEAPDPDVTPDWKSQMLGSIICSNIGRSWWLESCRIQCCASWSANIVALQHFLQTTVCHSNAVKLSL